MADVFISYRRVERDVTKVIRDRLTELGVSVWFDAGLSAGEGFSQEIDRELRTAKCILVCWSTASRDSKWVRSEALRGFEQGNLASILIDGPDSFDFPTPFNSVHAEDLRAWVSAPEASHAAWRSVVKRVGVLAGRQDLVSFADLDASASPKDLEHWVGEHLDSPLRKLVFEMIDVRRSLDQERQALVHERRVREPAAERQILERLPPRVATGPQRRIAIVTVHGTGDTAMSVDGGKWFQNGSAFATALQNRLGERNVDASIVPFLWSGANSERARVEAGERLALALKQVAARCDSVHVVCHAHGGGVANEAALLLDWSRRRAQTKVTGFLTVGTPYVVSVRSRWPWIVAVAVIAILAGLASALYELGATMLANRALGGREWVQSAFLLAGVASVAVFGRQIRGLMREVVGRRKPLKTADARFVAVWHPNDEALSFLQGASSLPIEPFPRGAVWRGSRVPALRFASLAAIGATVAALAQPLLLQEIPWPDRAGVWGPLAFLGGYVAARALGLAAEIGLRKRWNKNIGAMIRAMALGDDAGGRMRGLSTTSPDFESVPVVLDGEVAERMRASTANAANALIEKYRFTLFNTGQSGAFERMSMDALTWDSLVHTTYFDQPEIAELIADWVVREARL